MTKGHLTARKTCVNWSSMKFAVVSRACAPEWPDSGNYPSSEKDAPLLLWRSRHKVYEHCFCFAVNPWKIPVLNLDLTEHTSKLCFDYLSINSLHMFTNQGNIAMDTFHCPITFRTHSGTFSQSDHIWDQLNTFVCHLFLAWMGTPGESCIHIWREREHKMEVKGRVQTCNLTQKMHLGDLSLF